MSFDYENVECYNCREVGHMSRHCDEYNYPDRKSTNKYNWKRYDRYEDIDLRLRPFAFQDKKNGYWGVCGIPNKNNDRMLYINKQSIYRDSIEGRYIEFYKLINDYYKRTEKWFKGIKDYGKRCELIIYDGENFSDIIYCRVHSYGVSNRENEPRKCIHLIKLNYD